MSKSATYLTFILPLSLTYINDRGKINIKHSLFFLLIILTTSINSNGQQKVHDFTIFENQKLGPILMESTFFIYEPNKKANSGTCFVLAHVLENDTTSKRLDSTYFKIDSTRKFRFSKFKYFEVLITSAHVFEDIKGDYANISFREKLGLDYSIIDLALQIRQDGKPLWTQLDNNTDVAAIPILLPEIVTYDILVDDYLLFGSRLKQIGLATGDELSCVGFPYYTPSDTRYFPILRSGKYASYLGPHSVNDPYFLFDFKIFPGNSGGPVFVDYKSTVTPDTKFSYTSSAIIGIVSEQLKSIDGTQTLEVAKVIPSLYVYKTIMKIERIATEIIKNYDEKMIRN